jgi:predicted ATP-grasp superfamily ATP-dependent carboligase
MSDHFLLAGISTRALAQSAVRAGYQVTSLDFFGDSDQPSGARVFSLVRDLHQPPTLLNLAKAASTLADGVDAVVVESGLENERAFFELLPSEKMIGNSLQTVQAVRDPRQLQAALVGTKMHLPDTYTQEMTPPQSGRYLLKNLAHSGGMGVTEWDPNQPICEGEIVQEFIEGELTSACFIADGIHAKLLGISCQYAGEKALGAPPFAWCGNVIVPSPMPAQEMIEAALHALARTFGLVGLNGIDFILRDGIPWLIEVNPRPPASFELYERALGLNAFQLHIDACRGKLPEFIPVVPENPSFGKGILYTLEDVRLGDTSTMTELDIADIPHPGEEIPAGSPVCTLLETGNSPYGCWQKILSRVPDLKEQFFQKS